MPKFRSIKDFRAAMFPADVERERAATETPKAAGERLAAESLTASQQPEPINPGRAILYPHIVERASPQPERPQPEGEDEREWEINVEAVASGLHVGSAQGPVTHGRMMVVSKTRVTILESWLLAERQRADEAVHGRADSDRLADMFRDQREQAEAKVRELEGERGKDRDELTLYQHGMDEEHIALKAERDEAKDALKSLAERKLGSMESMTSDRDHLRERVEEATDLLRQAAPQLSYAPQQLQRKGHPPPSPAKERWLRDEIDTFLSSPHPRDSEGDK